MKITFLGAAQTVTGSCYLLEACGSRFTIDCGMHQGNAEIEVRNLDIKNYQPESLDFILLTHAHIDHSGLLPRMLAENFKGPIYCTPPTADLVALMLEDSAHIQEMEAEWKRKKMSRRTGQTAQALHIDPLYTMEDARKIPEHLKMVDYEKSFKPHPGITVTYHDAGHILGSAFIDLKIVEDGKPTHLVFSGDIGRPGTLLMHDPKFPTPADYIFVESTYGDRDHKQEDATLHELADAIAYSYKRKGKVIIPAFAVGRTQEILYSLYLLKTKGQLPLDLPIFVDSPLAIRATEIFRKYKEFLDTHDLNVNSELSVLLPQLKFTLSAAESQVLNTMKEPAIIISASGMCNAGRIKHHLRHNLWNPNSSIVFVGYQGMGTPGRKIVDGAKTIRLFNEDVAIEAKIFTINGFSAHAGQSQILDWLATSVNPKLNIILVHGEEKAQKTLSDLIFTRFNLKTTTPAYLETLTLQAAEGTMIASVPAPIKVDWAYLLKDIEGKTQDLHDRLSQAKDRSFSEQSEIKERLLDLNKELLSVLMIL